MPCSCVVSKRLYDGRYDWFISKKVWITVHDRCPAFSWKYTRDFIELIYIFRYSWGICQRLCTPNKPFTENDYVLFKNAYDTGRKDKKKLKEK